MAKTSGLGDRLLVGGVDISGDVGAIEAIRGGNSPLGVTGIDKSGMERIGGLKDGGLDWTSFFNPTGAHTALADLSYASRTVTYLRGNAAGNAGAGLVAKQIGYDPKRTADGGLTVGVACLASDAYPVEWGVQATAGMETVASLLTGASSTFEGGIGTWSLDGAATVAASSAQARTGTGSLAITATGTSDAGSRHVAGTTTGFATTPGRQYLLQGWFRAATAARTVRVQVSWYTSGGSLVATSTVGSATDSTSAWTLATGTATAPATAAFAVVKVYVVTPGGAGEVHYVDDVTFSAMPAGTDAGASSAFGLAAYLHVLAFTGTDATITLHSSSDDGASDAYSAITSGAFTQITAVGAQRIETSTGQAVERYLRPVITTAGGFSALTYCIVICRREAL